MMSDDTLGVVVADSRRHADPTRLRTRAPAGVLDGAPVHLIQRRRWQQSSRQLTSAHLTCTITSTIRQLGSQISHSAIYIYIFLFLQ